MTLHLHAPRWLSRCCRLCELLQTRNIVFFLFVLFPHNDLRCGVTVRPRFTPRPHTFTDTAKSETCKRPRVLKKRCGSDARLAVRHPNVDNVIHGSCCSVISAGRSLWGCWRTLAVTEQIVLEPVMWFAVGEDSSYQPDKHSALVCSAGVTWRHS